MTVAISWSVSWSYGWTTRFGCLRFTQFGEEFVVNRSGYSHWWTLRGWDVTHLRTGFRASGVSSLTPWGAKAAAIRRMEESGPSAVSRAITQVLARAHGDAVMPTWYLIQHDRQLLEAFG